MSGGPCKSSGEDVVGTGAEGPDGVTVEPWDWMQWWPRRPARATPCPRGAAERHATSAARCVNGCTTDNAGMPDAALTDADIDALQRELDALPAPLEPLDVAPLDGYLVGVLLQPRPVPAARWLRFVVDDDGRAPPPGLALDRLHALVRRRHAELDRAIERRTWFDPWVFELDADATPSQTVLPWVAGFALAMERFPGLMALDAASVLEPLAALYLHLDPDDLEDADELLAEIETLEPPHDLAEAVEGLVSASLMLADVSRPRRDVPPRGARRSRPAVRRPRR